MYGLGGWQTTLYLEEHRGSDAQGNELASEVGIVPGCACHVCLALPLQPHDVDGVWWWSCCGCDMCRCVVVAMWWWYDYDVVICDGVWWWRCCGGVVVTL